MTIYLDTHVVAWLYAGRLDLFPPPARSLMERHDLVISPIVRLELQYLHEVGKAAEPAAPVLLALSRDVGLKSCDLPFSDVMEVATEEDWTRDPFDRIVVAQARLRRAPLLTRDADIRDNYRDAVWDETGTGSEEPGNR